jgi:hypothetical protein
MEQRSLRLGDIVDDYCPRERRITNHVVVALTGDTIRQTRCATCEADHEYKEARVPKKKVKSDADATSPLAGGTLVAPRAAAPVTLETPVPHDAAPAAVNGAASGPVVQDAPRVDPVSPAAPAPAEPAPQDEPLHDGWLAHRPLIRASLPRVEGEQPAPRPIPEFTMHQRQGRGFGGGRAFRPFEGNGNHGQSRDGNGPNGNRPPGSGKGRHRRRRRPSGPR